MKHRIEEITTVKNKESSFPSRRIATCVSKENIFDPGSEQVELLKLKSFSFFQLPLSKIKVNAQSRVII